MSKLELFPSLALGPRPNFAASLRTALPSQFPRQLAVADIASIQLGSAPAARSLHVGRDVCVCVWCVCVCVCVCV